MISFQLGDKNSIQETPIDAVKAANVLDYKVASITAEEVGGISLGPEGDKKVEISQDYTTAVDRNTVNTAKSSDLKDGKSQLEMGLEFPQNTTSEKETDSQILNCKKSMEENNVLSCSTENEKTNTPEEKTTNNETYVEEKVFHEGEEKNRPLLDTNVTSALAEGEPSINNKIDIYTMNERDILTKEAVLQFEVNTENTSIVTNANTFATLKEKHDSNKVQEKPEKKAASSDEKRKRKSKHNITKQEPCEATIEDELNEKLSGQNSECQVLETQMSDHSLAKVDGHPEGDKETQAIKDKSGSDGANSLLGNNVNNDQNKETVAAAVLHSLDIIGEKETIEGEINSSKEIKAKESDTLSNKIISQQDMKDKNVYSEEFKLLPNDKSSTNTSAGTNEVEKQVPVQQEKADKKSLPRKTSKDIEKKGKKPKKIENSKNLEESLVVHNEAEDTVDKIVNVNPAQNDANNVRNYNGENSATKVQIQTLENNEDQEKIQPDQTCRDQIFLERQESLVEETALVEDFSHDIPREAGNVDSKCIGDTAVFDAEISQHDHHDWEPESLSGHGYEGINNGNEEGETS